jgi:hypothetical protein
MLNAHFTSAGNLIGSHGLTRQLRALDAIQLERFTLGLRALPIPVRGPPHPPFGHLLPGGRRGQIGLPRPFGERVGVRGSVRNTNVRRSSRGPAGSSSNTPRSLRLRRPEALRHCAP